MRNRDTADDTDRAYMRLALRLAKRGYGFTSPNPMVGALLVRRGRVIGQGWHRRAGAPHAEIEAIKDAEANGRRVSGATLYVTLEPCCTVGRTPPCTESIIALGIRRVVAGATDPNPKHGGRGFDLLRQSGIAVTAGVLADESTRLNEAFNHWIVHRTPFVTVKAAMSLDGKIATASGESKWITSEPARKLGMNLRQGADAILVGVRTVLADDPSLTVRLRNRGERARIAGAVVGEREIEAQRLRRIILDSRASTPLTAQVVSDAVKHLTTVVATRAADQGRVTALQRRVNVWIAPARGGQIDLGWVLKRLGAENVTGLLVEGGGEVNASFLLQRLAQRVVFFYGPKILGGRDARKGVAGGGAKVWSEILELTEVSWKRAGADLVMRAKICLPDLSKKQA